MLNSSFPSSQRRVDALQIKCPTFTSALKVLASALDAAGEFENWQTVGKSCRDAFEALGQHVSVNSAKELLGEGTARTANAKFEQFESKVSNGQQKELKTLRAKFQSIGNSASHGGTITQTDVYNAFNALLTYAEQWITRYAGDDHRRSIAYSDPYVDEIVSYRAAAKSRWEALMGNMPLDCYLKRTVAFRMSQTKDDKSQADKDADPLGWYEAKTRRDAADVALSGTPSTVELLRGRKQSLLLAQAGMGKSLEAARLAVELTNTDGPERSCCVVLECRLFEYVNYEIAGAFSASSTVAPSFETFCALKKWQKYLILDGFDELHHYSKKLYGEITVFQKNHPDVTILVTSRDTDVVSNNFPSWETYDLTEIDDSGVLDYLIKRLKANYELLENICDQFRNLDRHPHILRLLRVPFFLNAFVETVKYGDRIAENSRRKLVESFVFETLRREHRKKDENMSLTEMPLALRLTILDSLGKHAFRSVTRQELNLSPVLEQIASSHILLRLDDKQFRHSGVRDFFAARYLYYNFTTENRSRVGSLDYHQRFVLHGWLLEHVNDGVGEHHNRHLVLDWLWAEDPVLVSLGLFSDSDLRALAVPVHPWEPFEVGLIRILRGDDPRTLSEASEIRDLRLSSPGEKLLYRLQHPDLPYFIRAVPEGRAFQRLANAWSKAADTWDDLMRPLAPIAKDWIERHWQGAARVALFSFSVEPLDDGAIDLIPEIVDTAIQQQFETEVLVQLCLVLYKLVPRAASYDQERRQTVHNAIWKLRNHLFSVDRQLNARQIHRLLAEETRQKVSQGISKQMASSAQIQYSIYERDVDLEVDRRAVRMTPLVIELLYLKSVGTRAEARKLTCQLWDQVSTEVKAIPPITLSAALRKKITMMPDLLSSGWLERWMESWVDCLSAYETIRLIGDGVPFEKPPRGFIEAEGWIQARDASKLAELGSRLSGDAYAGSLNIRNILPQYSREQKRHWVATSSLYEILNLLYRKVILKSADGDIFEEAVRRLETTSRPQHWWDLVRGGMLTREDIYETAEELLANVEDDPVAYELLEGVGWYEGEPSKKVEGLAAQGKCPFKTRLSLVNRKRLSLEACWKAESEILQKIGRDIASGRPVTGPNGAQLPRKGGILPGSFMLIFRHKSSELPQAHFSHPATEDPIEGSDFLFPQYWDEGRVIAGFLWLKVNTRTGKYTLSVKPHSRGFQQTLFVSVDDSLVEKAPNEVGKGFL